MAAIHITDIESAINWWRERLPSPDGITACAEVRALAEVYALMVYYHEDGLRRGLDAAGGARGVARLVRNDAGRAVHRDLLDQPGRRHLQGLRPDLRRGPALAGDDAGREAPNLAPHHDGRHGLALQPLRRALAGGDPPTRRQSPAPTAEPLASTRHDPAASQSARRIAPLAWPMYIGQVAVLAFSTVDTVMVARHSALDLAALAIGGAAYISVFIGLMGVVMALGPIAGQLYGAGRLRDCGRELQQAMWLALALSVGGCALLLFPQPFLDLARTPPEVEGKVRGYLTAIAFALPPALLFTAYRAFNIAVSRPKAVMALQLGALLLKVPLTALLVFGLAVPTPFGELRVPAFGAPGCGIATAIVMWCQLGSALWWLLRRDPFYARFGLRERFSRPDRASLWPGCCAWACRWACRSWSRSPASRSWRSSFRASARRRWPATRSRSTWSR